MSNESMKRQIHFALAAPVGAAIALALSSCSPNAASISKSLLAGGHITGSNAPGPNIGIIVPGLDRTKSLASLDTKAELQDPKAYNSMKRSSSDETDEEEIRVELAERTPLEDNLIEFRRKGSTELIIDQLYSGDDLRKNYEMKAYLELNLSKSQIREFGLDGFDISLNLGENSHWILTSDKQPSDPAVDRTFDSLKAMTLVIRHKPRIERQIESDPRPR